MHTERDIGVHSLPATAKLAATQTIVEVDRRDKRVSRQPATSASPSGRIDVILDTACAPQYKRRMIAVRLVHICVMASGSRRQPSNDQEKLEYTSN